jgi:hypothetical protein
VDVLPSSCPERIGVVECAAAPPDCEDGTFPAAAGGCWTGECLDCIDGCQDHAECVVVVSCGCGYHEGCSWAVTTFRQALETDECNVVLGSACFDDCPSSLCPGQCEGEQRDHCCGWCDYDRAECTDGVCVGIVEHMCE